MSDLRINLLFGFLGSGKTTLVRRILGERGGERPMAVIVNEFGDVGVDGDVIAGNSVDLVELTSGCLCCTLRGSLMSAVEELREKAAVEQIVVEATGVASPGDMLEDLNDSRIAHEIDVGPLVTVVDAPKFTRLQQMLGEFYEEQVENADVLVLNKIDLATQAELDEARAAVREINPDAVLLFAEQGDTDLALLLDGPESELLAQMKAEAAGDAHHGHNDRDDHGRHGDAHDRRPRPRPRPRTCACTCSGRVVRHGRGGGLLACRAGRRIRRHARERLASEGVSHRRRRVEPASVHDGAARNRRRAGARARLPRGDWRGDRPLRRRVRGARGTEGRLGMTDTVPAAPGIAARHAVRESGGAASRAAVSATSREGTIDLPA